MKNFETSDELKSKNSTVKGKVICKILTWWLATVPFALFCSYGITRKLI